MWSRTRAGGSLGLLIVLTVSTGCLNPHFHLNTDSPISMGGSAPKSSGAFAADKSATMIPDNRRGGEVVSQPSVTQVGYEQPTVGGPPASMPGSVQLPQPNAVGPGGLPTIPQVPDPHNRNQPTARGSVLNLGPDDQPLDRALEMNRRYEQLTLEYRGLIDRIKTLEANAVIREDNIKEGVRDVQAAAIEVARTRNELTTVRQEMTALRERVKRMEQDEIDTLKKMIGVLQKLLQEQDE